MEGGGRGGGDGEDMGYNNGGLHVEIIDMERDNMEGKITPIIAAKHGWVVEGKSPSLK